ncbi:MAG: hypothetical protein ACFE8B_13060 [Candidatus Hermodarchaeota archaeon]
MHINATCGYYWDQWFGCSFEIDIELTGSGKIDDPFILKAKSPYDSKHCELKISRTNQYLEVQGIHLRALYLNHCTNINISDLDVKYFGLRNCSIVTIQNAQVTKEVRINKCTDMKISESGINRLTVFSGDQLYFYNCDIKKLSKTTKAFQEEEVIMIE